VSRDKRYVTDHNFLSNSTKVRSDRYGTEVRMFCRVRNLRKWGSNGIEPVTRNTTGRQRAVEHISNDIG